MNIEDLRKHILDYNDLPVKKVPIPEWGDVTLYVRSMSAAERDSFMYEKYKDRDEESGEIPFMENITAATLARVICSDPEGQERVFTDEDVIALGQKSAKALQRLGDAVKELNGDLVSEEEMEKNSEGQSEDSGLSEQDDQE